MFMNVQQTALGWNVGTTNLSFNLTVDQMPYHNHNILYSSGTGADGGIWGKNSVNSGNFGAPNATGVMGYAVTATAGGGQPVNL